MSNIELLEKTLPAAPLKLIAMESCRELGQKVNDYIVSFRENTINEVSESSLYVNYKSNNYLVDCCCPRFGTGEAKGLLKETIRGTDLFIMTDVCNHNLTYTVNGHLNHMSPDDHFQDLKRIISAATGKAKRINVIMPFLYESRQHKRTKRESLDCALALEELNAMGVSNIVTFDAHDPRVQNAIPLSGFDSFNPPYQFMKALFRAVPDLIPDKDHLMIISLMRERCTAPFIFPIFSVSIWECFINAVTILQSSMVRIRLWLMNFSAMTLPEKMLSS